jgi:predicted alpha/beta hydrolase family esterase
MRALRVLILHGWQGSGPDHWQTWLAGRLRERGAQVRYPDLPDCDVPCPDRWGAALHAELRALAAGDDDAERVVVCHSLGCVLWLREAAGLAPGLHVDRVALVAPPCPGAAVPELAGFYPTGADKAAIDAAAGHTRLVCSDDDPYCPGRGAAEHWGRPLELVVDLVPGAGHLNVEAGYGPWPEMEAWCAGERETLLRSPAQIGEKNGAEM